MYKHNISIKKIKQSIEWRVIDEEFTLPEELSIKIDSYWLELTNENPHLTRGKTFCIQNIERQSNSLIVNLSQSDYAHYMYTLHKPIAEEFACRICFGVALVETNDKKYIIGQMNPTTATPNRVQLPGGGIDNRDIKNNKVDLTSNVLRELEEETGLSKRHIISCLPTYLKQGGTHDFIAIIYKINLNISAQQVHDLFHVMKSELLARGEIPELVKLYSLNKEEKSIKSFLDKTKHPVVDYLLDTLVKDSTPN